jgi:hypothetical protein
MYYGDRIGHLVDSRARHLTCEADREFATSHTVVMWMTRIPPVTTQKWRPGSGLLRFQPLQVTLACWIK